MSVKLYAQLYLRRSPSYSRGARSRLGWGGVERFGRWRRESMASCVAQAGKNISLLITSKCARALLQINFILAWCGLLYSCHVEYSTRKSINSVTLTLVHLLSIISLYQVQLKKRIYLSTYMFTWELSKKNAALVCSNIMMSYVILTLYVSPIHILLISCNCQIDITQ
jgi:hypothetical protein